MQNPSFTKIIGKNEDWHSSLIRVSTCWILSMPRIYKSWGAHGWIYHIVCRHGVTAASKFLTLQESVRDPADLYLSFKHYPLVFICDTPCGFVRHVDCRDPGTTGHLWGSFGGCLEEPSLEKMPTKDISLPAVIPAEYRDASNPYRFLEITTLWQTLFLVRLGGMCWGIVSIIVPTPTSLHYVNSMT